MKKIMITTSVLALAGLFMLIGCNTNEDCYETGDQDFQRLNAMFVYKLALNYKNNQLGAITNGSGVSNDARSVWFDLETLKRFVKEIENQTCGQCDVPERPVLGIRIYYGAYPAQDQWETTLWGSTLENVPEQNALKHTLVMMPTYRKNLGTEENPIWADMDFDPGQVHSDCNFKEVGQLFDSLAVDPTSGLTLLVLAGIEQTAQNHGDMIPPPYDRVDIRNKGAGLMYAVDQYPDIQ